MMFGRKIPPPVQVAASAGAVTVTIDKAHLEACLRRPDVLAASMHGDWGGAEYPEFSFGAEAAKPLLLALAAMIDGV